MFSDSKIKFEAKYYRMKTPAVENVSSDCLHVGCSALFSERVERGSGCEAPPSQYFVSPECKLAAVKILKAHRQQVDCSLTEKILSLQ